MPSKTVTARRRQSAPLAVIGLLVILAGCSAAEPGVPDPGSSASTGVGGGGAAASPSPTEPATSPGETAGAPASTPVPPPTPGDVTGTVPVAPQESKRPVSLNKQSSTGTGLTAKLTKIESIKATARMPGEVSGPALAFSVSVTNDGNTAADLSAVVVTLTDADEAPGGEMSAGPAKPLGGVLGPGETERGVYVFTVPSDKRNPIRVDLTLGDSPVLVFTGNVD